MNPVELVFLGTASAAPTETRNLSAMALRTEGEWLLFDCPEGCQQQMLRSGVSYMKIHARIHPLYLYCPEGWKPKLQKLVSLAPKTDFEILFKEVQRGTVWQTPEYTVSCVPLKHEIACVGYIFLQTGKTGEFQRKKAIELKIPEGPLWAKLAKGEKIKIGPKTISPEHVMDYSKATPGLKIAYVADTMPTKSYYNAIKDASILIHEATFLEKDHERAKQTLHSTAKQAGRVASETNAKQLILTHFSARHKELEQLENEARQEFGNVEMANDLEHKVLKGDQP